MKKKYKLITFPMGSSIASAMTILRKDGDLAYGDFNGHKLYSDVDDIDSAYKKITGKTKAEFDAEQQREDDAREAHKVQHKEAIPLLTEEWIEKGRAVLHEQYMPLWIKIVPIRLSDLYEGMELGACLEIVSELNKGCDMDVAKKIIEEQGHSGMSFGLVRSMVRSLCARGEVFYLYCK